VAVPGLRAYMVRRNLRDLSDNHLESRMGFRELLAPWIAAGRCSIVGGGPWTIRFANNSSISLDQCNSYPDVVKKYQGSEIHLLLVDELTQVEDRVYRYLRSRVRLGALVVPTSYPGVLPQILASSNPGGIAHSAVKARWIDPVPPNVVWKAEEEDGGMVRQFIPSLLSDNPTMEHDPEYRKRLAGLGDSALVRAMLEGDWDIAAGGFFEDVQFRDRVIVKPFQIPDSWRVFRAFDYGASHPFSVGWWALTDGNPGKSASGPVHLPGRSLVLIAEWYGCDPAGKPNVGLNLTSRAIAKGIRERERQLGYKVLPGPADPSVWGNDHQGSSIANEMAAEGITFTQGAGGLRAPGWRLVKDRMLASMAQPRENPCLLVFDTCREWIRTVPPLPRKPMNPDDVDTDAEDHAGDMTRYAVCGKVHVSGSQEWRV
jgi:hypothetical protein